MEWNERAIKFYVGTCSNYRVFIEGVFNKNYPRQGDQLRWAVRLSDGLSALCKPHDDLKKYDFLVESDFHGEDRSLVRFDTKEEALEAYNAWKRNGGIDE